MVAIKHFDMPSCCDNCDMFDGFNRECLITYKRYEGSFYLYRKHDDCPLIEIETQESDHKCHTCKHYTSGEHDGSCGSYICKGYSNWESEEE